MVINHFKRRIILQRGPVLGTYALRVPLFAMFLPSVWILSRNGRQVIKFSLFQYFARKHFPSIVVTFRDLLPDSGENFSLEVRTLDIAIIKIQLEMLNEA